MKNVVLIPAFDRPEFLEVCLELIGKADNAKDLKYIFCLDHGYNKQIDSIVDGFDFDKEVFKPEPVNRKKSKLSNNILSGLLGAADLTGNLIYLVEDDIFVGKDFFTLHEKIHEKCNLFCSIASANHNSNFNTTNNPNAFYFAHFTDYQPWGVCFKKEVVDSHIRKHVNTRYFSSPEIYLRDNFQNSFIPSVYTEQAGLLRRIRERLSKELNVAFPHVPRCFHAGFYGKNRTNLQLANKPLKEKINLVRDVCFSEAKMRAYVLNEDYFEDSRPVNLNTSFSKLEFVPCNITAKKRGSPFIIESKKKSLPSGKNSSVVFRHEMEAKMNRRRGVK